MRKAMLNYWVDVVIGVAYVLSALSGLVFLLPQEIAEVLGIHYATWDLLHIWSSLAMMVGVTVHLVLHRKWIVGMTRNLWTGTRRAMPEITCTSAPGLKVSRRRFLSLGLAGVAMAAITGLFMLSRRADAAQSTGDTRPDTTPDGNATSEVSADTEQITGDDMPAGPVPPLVENDVSCPKGLVNDPYPGRCRRYRDRNGNGFCDYSEPGSGQN